MTSARTLAHALLLTLTSGSTLVAAQPAPQRGDIRHDESAMLPVSSPSLSPGDVESRDLELPALTRLFLVGDDPRSLAWLTEHADSLRQLGAAGLAVEVASMPALERIRRAGPGLTILPVSGEDIGQRLGLRHYPVLIRTDRLEQ
ncbi:MAG TPA: integrating conjugative element protein [Pseudomonas sp.]|nr:integrating conjugative element protein [Pseudomonas sp.]